MRSSVNCRDGDEGPAELKPFVASEPRFIEDDRMGGTRGVEGEEGIVGAREGARDVGCCRIRRKPDMPSPCSCSEMMGDLAVMPPGPASKDTCIFPSLVVFPALLALASRSPVLLFLGMQSGLTKLLGFCSYSSFDTTCRRAAVPSDHLLLAVMKSNVSAKKRRFLMMLRRNVACDSFAATFEILASTHDHL